MTPKYNFILLLFFACITTHAQEYSITEIDSIAYTFFNEGPQYAPGIDGNHPKKQISSIAAISRDSTNYMYLANTITAEDRRIDALYSPTGRNDSRIASGSGTVKEIRL